MGRPPLNIEETKVRLSTATKARIAAMVGTYGMAQYIRTAVEVKLARDEKRPAPKASNDSADA
ncbi:hypothetical protein MKK50_15075 [Methylobacterium sp. J-043]|nr:hypothetical protein [Methylobacterium sp. J-043]